MINIASSKTLASVLITGMLIGLLSPVALSESDFSHWEAKPLVDYSTTQKQSAASNAAIPPEPKQSGPSAQEIEARLKPAEPFIAAVEERLTVKPASGSFIVQRLNTLQIILFGTTQYADAGELLVKLGEMFPEEAAKAQAAIAAQMQRDLPPQPAAASQTVSSSKNTPPPMVMMAQPQPMQQSQKKKRGFWHDDDWDDFENDPFFQDNHDSDMLQRSGSGFSNLARGVGSLAMLAGSIAGMAYLNKKMPTPHQQGYYPDSRYYPNGVLPYGYPAYGQPYGNGYYPQPQSYPYGATPYITPYQPRYQPRSSTGVSSLGVPTSRLF